MLTAIRNSDKIKVFGNLIEKDLNELYNCDFCKEKVRHYKSVNGNQIGHFKHISNSECPNSRESAEHLEAKFGIFSFIKEKWNSKLLNIEIEKSICEDSIRPDVYIETEQSKIAIEVQASVLTIDEIKRRTEKYFKNNIYVLWVLLFDYNSFYEYQTKYGYDEEGLWCELDSGYFLKEKIRFKQFEIFIYKCYEKNIVLWDNSLKYSNGFIVAKMNDYKTESGEYFKDGAINYFEGKTTKVLKKVVDISFNINFNQFKVLKSINDNDSLIPYRSILIFNDKSK